MQKRTDNFEKIFWLLVGCLFVAFLYVFLITFTHIPKENIRFADTALGFVLGTVITGCLAYFIGSSPNAHRSEPSAPGTTTAEVTATVSTTPTPEA